MRRNIFLVLLLATIFVFVGATNNVRATNEAVEFMKSAKTPVYLHSMAGGEICNPPFSDSLVHEELTQVCNWWHSLYPPQTYCHIWHVIDQYENGTSGLNPSDWIRLEHVPTTPGDSIWVHVEDVTITLKLKERITDSIIYVEFERGYIETGNLFVNEALLPPVIGDTLHGIWPQYSQRYLLNSWVDSGTPFGQLSCSDTIDIKGPLPNPAITYWHVEDVTIDIAVLSGPVPRTPTMTQWGMIILVALIVGSAVFIMLKRRRAAVPA